jgi:dihydrodipicolinate reductase
VLVTEAGGPASPVIVEGLSRQAGIEVIGTRRADARDLGSLLRDSDVIVAPSGAPAHVLLRAIQAGVRPVSETDGLSDHVLLAIDQAARGRGIAAVCAPGFCVAGALMTHMCRVAADVLEGFDIDEDHGAGTEVTPSRSGMREVSFRGPCETLTIRHEACGPEALVSGMARAIRRVVEPDVVGLLRGLEMVLGLTGPDPQPRAPARSAC